MILGLDDTFLCFPSYISVLPWVLSCYSEHQELSHEISEATDPQIREDLEREPGAMVTRMEGKNQQISKIRRHQSKVRRTQSSCSIQATVFNTKANIQYVYDWLMAWIVLIFLVLPWYSEHQDLSHEISEATDPQIREDLERELDAMVTRMQGKSQEISKIRRHQSKVRHTQSYCLKLNTPLRGLFFQPV